MPVCSQNLLTSHGPKIQRCFLGLSLENNASSWLRCRGRSEYRDLETQTLQSANQRPFELLGVMAVEVVCSQITIGLLILEHMEQDHQDRVAHGHDGALFPFARG